MSGDLLERLRRTVNLVGDDVLPGLLTEAADEIARLRSLLATAKLSRAELKEALRPFAWEHTYAWIAPRAAFARAAELVPATSPPPSAPSAAAPETT